MPVRKQTVKMWKHLPFVPINWIWMNVLNIHIAFGLEIIAKEWIPWTENHIVRNKNFSILFFVHNVIRALTSWYMQKKHVCFFLQILTFVSFFCSCRKQLRQKRKNILWISLKKTKTENISLFFVKYFEENHWSNMLHYFSFCFLINNVVWDFAVTFRGK